MSAAVKKRGVRRQHPATPLCVSRLQIGKKLTTNYINVKAC